MEWCTDFVKLAFRAESYHRVQPHKPHTESQSVYNQITTPLKCLDMLELYEARHLARCSIQLIRFDLQLNCINLTSLDKLGQCLFRKAMFLGCVGKGNVSRHIQFER